MSKKGAAGSGNQGKNNNSNKGNKGGAGANKQKNKGGNGGKGNQNSNAGRGQNGEGNNNNRNQTQKWKQQFTGGDPGSEIGARKRKNIYKPKVIGLDGKLISRKKIAAQLGVSQWAPNIFVNTIRKKKKPGSIGYNTRQTLQKVVLPPRPGPSIVIQPPAPAPDPVDPVDPTPVDPTPVDPTQSTKTITYQIPQTRIVYDTYTITEILTYYAGYTWTENINDTYNVYSPVLVIYRLTFRGGQYVMDTSFPKFTRATTNSTTNWNNPSTWTTY